MSSVRIGSDLEIGKTDYNQPAKFTWREFYGFRNNVIRALREFGSTGPLGEVDLSTNDDEAPEFIGENVHDPEFFVVDDMYNAHDRISVVECDVRSITARVLQSLIDVAALFPGWYIMINMGDSGLRVFGDAVLVGGRRFWDCCSVDEIGNCCGREIDYGPAPVFRESMYGLWTDLLCGGFNSAQNYPDAPDREWNEAIYVLENLVRQNNGASLRAHVYDRIRYDLHPQTRRRMLERFMGELGSFPPGRVEAARRNLQHDIADALAMPQTAEEVTLLVGRVSKAQSEALASSDPKDVVFWWPYIIQRMLDDDPHLGSSDVGIGPILGRGMRLLLENENQWIQLSGVFGLAKLGASDIADVVNNALQTNPNWLANDSLLKWLLQIRAGSARYPSGLVLP